MTEIERLIQEMDKAQIFIDGDDCTGYNIWDDLKREITAMTAERDKYHDAWLAAEGKHSEEHTRADNAIAERDALVGAVIEQAIWQVRSSVPGHMMVCDTERICDAIRALATTDHHAALEAVKAKARADGMRKAAEYLNHHLSTKEDAAIAEVWIEIILAAAENEVGK